MHTITNCFFFKSCLKGSKTPQALHELTGLLALFNVNSANCYNTIFTFKINK